MKKTPRVSIKQPVRAEHINAISEVILELQTALMPRKFRPPPQSWDTKPNLWVSEPFNEVPSPGTPVWKVTVTPGYLIQQQVMLQSAIAGTAPGGGVEYYVPTIGGISIETDPAPKITVDPTGFIYLEATTSKKGLADDTVTIVFSATLLTTTQHDRVGASGGTTGTYRWLIAKLVPDAADASRPKISQRLPEDKFYALLTNGDDFNVDYYYYSFDADGALTDTYDYTVYYREGIAFYEDPGGTPTSTRRATSEVFSVFTLTP
jgi:hypothetical protein